MSFLIAYTPFQLMSYIGLHYQSHIEGKFC